MKHFFANTLLSFIVLIMAIFYGCATIKSRWKNAEAKNTIEVYEDFIKRYPEGELATEARQRIEVLYYKRARSTNTIQALEEFLNLYPDGQLRIQALSYLDTLYFQSAKAADNLSAYDAYLERYPQGKYRTETRQRIHKLAFQFARQKDSLHVYREFQQRYPENEFSAEVNKRMEEFTYQSAKQKDDMPSYQDFLKEFPSGQYVNAVKQRMDYLPCKALWAKDDTLKRFWGYIGDIPIGTFLKKKDDKLEGYLDYEGFPFSFHHSNESVYRGDYDPKTETYRLNGAISKNGSIKISGYGIFNGHCNGDKIEGTWTDLWKGSLKYKFSLWLSDNNDWLTYTDKKLGIEFKYPSNATVKKATDKNRDIFRPNENIKKDFIEISIPLDANTDLQGRDFFISTWKDDSCCSSAIEEPGVFENADKRKLGQNTYYIRYWSDNGMNHYVNTVSYSTCRTSDKRCFAFHYETEGVGLGPYDVPYLEDYYDYSYVKGDDIYNDGFAPKPVNQRAEQDMIEHIIASLKFIESKK